MDLTLEALGPWLWMLLLSIVLWPLTGLIKKPLELIPGLKGKHWWEDSLLPAIPVILGVVFALVARKYPFPIKDPSASVRAILGMVCGFMSANVYRGAKAWIKSKYPKAAAVVAKVESVEPPAVKSDPPPPESAAG